MEGHTGHEERKTHLWVEEKAVVSPRVWLGTLVQPAIIRRSNFMVRVRVLLMLDVSMVFVFDLLHVQSHEGGWEGKSIELK